MSLESSPSTASAKHKRLAKHELSKKSKKSGTSRQVGRAGKRSERAETKGKATLEDKAGKEASNRQANLQKGRHTKGCIERLALLTDQVNWKYRLAGEHGTSTKLLAV